MSTRNRLVLLTVGMVVLAGVLSGLGAFLQVRNLSSEYDQRLKEELTRTGLVSGWVADSFLSSLGPDALAALDKVTREGLSRSQEAEIDGAEDTASNLLVRLEVWVPDASGLGFQRIYSQQLQDVAQPADDSPMIQGMLEDFSENDGPAAVIDEADAFIHIAFPLPLPDGREAVGVGSLSADEQFAFFAAQRSESIRNAILLSVGIVAFTGAVGTGLSVAVSRTLTGRQQAEEVLRASESRYRSLFEEAPVPLAEQDLTRVWQWIDDLRSAGVTDLETHFDSHPAELAEAASLIRTSDVNSAAVKLFDASSKEDLLHRWRETFTPETYGSFQRAVLALAEGAKSVELEAQLSTLRGDPRTVQVHVSASPSGRQGSSRLLLSFVDVTERQRVEQALRDSEEKFRTLAETVPVATFVYDQGGVRYQNRAAEELGGYSREELKGMDFWKLVAPDRLAGQDVPSRYESKVRSKTGEERWVDLSLSQIRYEGEPAVLGCAVDITERKMTEELLREQVRRDPLTGMLNHAAIVGELQILLRDGAQGRCAVAMVDVDGMKATNDTYGHQTGDDVLIKVSQALNRDGAVVGRYGGDEFVAIVPGADRLEAERYRRGVHEALARKKVTDADSGASVPVSVSVGLAVYPEEAATVIELIQLSDDAMYASRLRRPVRSNPGGMPRRRDERAAKMVGELVPLLTSEEALEDKLRHVGHRLSVGAGYDGVNIEIFERGGQQLAVANTFARLPEDIIRRWSELERHRDGTSLREIVSQTRRPVVANDAQNDQRLREVERELARRSGIRSLIAAPMLWHDELVGILTVGSKRGRAFSSGDTGFLLSVATEVTAIVRTAALVDDLEQARDDTVMLLAAAAEAHNGAMGTHLRNVQALSEALARQLGYSEDDARDLGLAAVLHDVGKIRVPEAVLATSTELSPDDWELIWRHTIWGEEFLAGKQGFELAAMIARSHHERWDGGGYPDGLYGDAIPEEATIVAVADAFDAMTGQRSYRTSVDPAGAIAEVERCSGTQFNPRAVDALAHLWQRGELPSAWSTERAVA